MNAEAFKLRQEIPQEEKQLTTKKDRLADIERNCHHVWGGNLYKPDYRPGYTIPGDKPGTMGSDYRGETHVPSKTIERWEHVCQECGKVETTTRTESSITRTPLF